VLKIEPGIRVVSLKETREDFTFWQLRKNTCAVAIQAMLTKCGINPGIDITSKRAFHLFLVMGSSASKCCSSFGGLQNEDT